MPYRRVEDPEKLKALVAAALIVESDLDLDATLRRFVEEAVRLAGARYGAIGVLGDTGEGLSRFITTGLTGDEIAWMGEPPTGQGVLGLLIREPAPIRLVDLSEHPASVGFPPHHPPMKSFLGLPIRVRHTVYGNLYLTEKQGASEFTQEDEDLVSGLAAAAGIAIENAHLHERVAQLALADDRERIARDLHDTVIQRLFAVGLSLQSVLGEMGNGGARQRIADAVDNLDQTIREVRTAIFSLEATPETRKGLRAQILAATTEVGKELGFEPEVRFAGAIDSQVGDSTAAALITGLREMLYNVAQHARASSVDVEVTLEKDEILLEVTDNGAGMPPDGPATQGQGIAAICAAAVALGGTCIIRNAPAGGTIVSWRAPA